VNQEAHHVPLYSLEQLYDVAYTCHAAMEGGHVPSVLKGIYKIIRK